LRYHAASNMPFWKADKYIRKITGANPFRAHDAIGAKGANFLTWSCLHHLSRHYGSVFEPARSLVERKDSGQNWYPPNHFRPLVDWTLEPEEEDEFRAWILGPLFQMTSLMLHENRSHLAQMNAIGELCAQFTRGVLAVARRHGAEGVIRRVEAYHRLHPEAAEAGWYPVVFEQISSPAWQQLYVNAEHDGRVGIVSISRESYNADVDEELNRAIDWLKAAGIERVIVTGDFHMSTQMVGADTNDFFSALEDSGKGVEIASSWSRTARRLNDEFATSVGFINGKRCLGGMLELLSHCHFLIAESDAALGMPEVTLPVVPGMEGCHWLLRKTARKHWPDVLRLLLEGKSVPAKRAVGWLVDYTGSLEESIRMSWQVAAGDDHPLERRAVAANALEGVAGIAISLDDPGSPATRAARKAILDCVHGACGAPLTAALEIQAKHSGAFMVSDSCLNGVVGATYKKTMMPA
ncbi:MAG: enoyl-CoA hydratase/isomerase family protein, partial [Acidobacteriota bacterium]